MSNISKNEASSKLDLIGYQNIADRDDVRIVRKRRVGGGYKFVKVNNGEGKKHHESEKQDYEKSEKTDGGYDTDDTSPHKKSAEEYIERLSLALSSTELSRENSVYILSVTAERNGEAKYDDHPILKFIQDSVIGCSITINGPFGPKRAIYCDYTASGRSLVFIEDYIRDYVCPYYANTHSETGRNSLQTTKFREEARSIIKKCVNAGKDDVVIFTGSGATAAIHKIAWGLKMNYPRVAKDTAVLIGPYEHHANILLWKEFGTTVVRVRDNALGKIDMGHLASELKFWRDKKRNLIVSVSAASNVTGIITDTEQVARLAHQYGAYACFDFAGGGPYLKIDMNPSKNCHKDAVFLSPHKFVGGPGSPGIVVAKKWMFKNQVPDRVGGGTVQYVSRDSHEYKTNIEVREEGGTPAIIESIRTGLVFHLKAAVTEELIAAREEMLCRRAFAVWERNSCLNVLGNHAAERLTIFSFIVKHPDTEKYIHHAFISTLLNDLYGIQSRSGCACAGPYGHDLLGVSETKSKQFKWFLSVQHGMDANFPQTPIGIMKPGFSRVSLPYFYDNETVDYIINAVDMVATHGWKLLPSYKFNPFSGVFVYKKNDTDKDEEFFSLHDIDYTQPGKFHVNRRPPDCTNISLRDMQNYAENVFREAAEDKMSRQCSASRKLRDLIPKERRKILWFLTPQEANDIQTGVKKVRNCKQILTPRIANCLIGLCSATETPRNTSSGQTAHEEQGNGQMKKNRKLYETHVNKVSKLNKLYLEDISEENGGDMIYKIIPKIPEGNPLDPLSPGKIKDIALIDSNKVNQHKISPPLLRQQKPRMILPKI